MNKNIYFKLSNSTEQTESVDFFGGDTYIGNLIYEIKNPQGSICDVILDEKSRNSIIQIINEYKNIDKLVEFGNVFPASKILLEGNSGCGKTLTATAIASELKKSLIIVNLNEIVSSRLGETSKNLNKIIKYAINQNAILFFDEFDSLSKDRLDDKDLGEMKRIVNGIIQLLDFNDSRLIIIAATNNITVIDKAIIRRFEHFVNFELPDIKQIIKYLEYLEYHYEGKILIEDKELVAKKLLNKDFYSIKVIINNLVKQNIISSKSKRLKLIKINKSHF